MLPPVTVGVGDDADADATPSGEEVFGGDSALGKILGAKQRRGRDGGTNGGPIHANVPKLGTGDGGVTSLPELHQRHRQGTQGTARKGALSQRSGLLTSRSTYSLYSAQNSMGDIPYTSRFAPFYMGEYEEIARERDMARFRRDRMAAKAKQRQRQRDEQRAARAVRELDQIYGAQVREAAEKPWLIGPEQRRAQEAIKAVRIAELKRQKQIQRQMEAERRGEAESFSPSRTADPLDAAIALGKKREENDERPYRRVASSRYGHMGGRIKREPTAHVVHEEREPLKFGRARGVAKKKQYQGVRSSGYGDLQPWQPKHRRAESKHNGKRRGTTTHHRRRRGDPDTRRHGHIRGGQHNSPPPGGASGEHEAHLVTDIESIMDDSGKERKRRSKARRSRSRRTSATNRLQNDTEAGVGDAAVLLDDINDSEPQSDADGAGQVSRRRGRVRRTRGRTSRAEASDEGRSKSGAHVAASPSTPRGRRSRRTSRSSRVSQLSEAGGAEPGHGSRRSSRASHAARSDTKNGAVAADLSADAATGSRSRRTSRASRASEAKTTESAADTREGVADRRSRRSSAASKVSRRHGDHQEAHAPTSSRRASHASRDSHGASQVGGAGERVLEREGSKTDGEPAVPADEPETNKITATVESTSQSDHAAESKVVVAQEESSTTTADGSTKIIRTTRTTTTTTRVVHTGETDLAEDKSQDSGVHQPNSSEHKERNVEAPPQPSRRGSAGPDGMPDAQASDSAAGAPPPDHDLETEVEEGAPAQEQAAPGVVPTGDAEGVSDDEYHDDFEPDTARRPEAAAATTDAAETKEAGASGVPIDDGVDSTPTVDAEVESSLGHDDGVLGAEKSPVDNNAPGAPPKSPALAPYDPHGTYHNEAEVQDEEDDGIVEEPELIDAAARAAKEHEEQAAEEVDAEATLETEAGDGAEPPTTAANITSQEAADDGDGADDDDDYPEDFDGEDGPGDVEPQKPTAGTANGELDVAQQKVDG